MTGVKGGAQKDARVPAMTATAVVPVGATPPLPIRDPRDPDLGLHVISFGTLTLTASLPPPTGKIPFFYAPTTPPRHISSPSVSIT